MAKVMVETTGGEAKIVDAENPKDLREKLGLSSDFKAHIDGEEVSDSYSFSKGEYVDMEKNVEGGAILRRRYRIG